MSATITGYTLNKYTVGSTAPHYQLWVDVEYSEEYLHGDGSGPTSSGTSYDVEFGVWTSSPGHDNITHYHDLGNLTFNGSTSEIIVRIKDGSTVLATETIGEDEAKIKNTEPDGIRPLNGGNR